MKPRLLRRSTERIAKGRRRDDGVDFSEMLGGYEPPTFPAIVTQALDALGDPEVAMGDVAALVERDPGATSRVLRLVNSATFSPRSKVTSVQQATMMLGRNQLEALLISVGARAVLPSPDVAGFDHRRFWTTAAKRAALASMVAERIDPTRRSENFTAALLQDMAIPVLAERTAPYPAILEQWHNSTDDLASLELGHLGWHHGQVAGWMGRAWNFPDDFVSFMAGHHDQETTDHLSPARMVSPIREADLEGDLIVIDAGPGVGLTTDELAVMIGAATDEAQRLAALLA